MINYSSWSKPKLIKEIEMLRDGLHQANREMTAQMILNDKRRRMIEFFENIDLSLPGEHHTNQNTRAETHDR